MPAGPGWAWGWRGDAFCFIGKEFGQACQAGWDNPGRMRWGFAAEQQGLSGFLTDPCIWDITESSGRAWRIWVGWSDTLSSPSAGAYYPAQGVQQFSAGVPTAQVIVSQQPPIPPKRERKTVRSHLLPGMGGYSCAGGCVHVQEGDGISPRCWWCVGWDVMHRVREKGWHRAVSPWAGGLSKGTGVHGGCWRPWPSRRAVLC